MLRVLDYLTVELERVRVTIHEHKILIWDLILSEGDLHGLLVTCQVHRDHRFMAWGVVVGQSKS